MMVIISISESQKSIDYFMQYLMMMLTAAPMAPAKRATNISK